MKNFKTDKIREWEYSEMAFILKSSSMSLLKESTQNKL